MAGLVGVKLSGFEEIDRNCRAAVDALADEKLLEGGLRYAAEPIRDGWRAGIPRDSGATADDVQISGASSAGVAKVEIGARSGKSGRAFILGFIEYGTSKMPARPSGRQAYDAHKGSITSRAVEFWRPKLARLWGGAR